MNLIDLPRSPLAQVLDSRPLAPGQGKSEIDAPNAGTDWDTELIVEGRGSGVGIAPPGAEAQGKSYLDCKT